MFFGFFRDIEKILNLDEPSFYALTRLRFIFLSVSKVMNTLQKLIFRHFFPKGVEMPSHPLKNSVQVSHGPNCFLKVLYCSIILTSIFPLQWRSLLFSPCCGYIHQQELAAPWEAQGVGCHWAPETFGVRPRQGNPNGNRQTQGQKLGWRWGRRLQTKLWLMLGSHPRVRFSPLSRFAVDIRKRFFTVRVVWHHNRYPRKAVDAQSLEVVKIRLDRALSYLAWWKMFLPIAGSLELGS